MALNAAKTAEHQRLLESDRRERNWQRWGPYLAERQWGTVREDYSADGNCWNYLPHDHARSRAYRWGEDGLLGICDREARLCFAVALWNGHDPILKERLYGVVNDEGNHGEDVKECYYYLDSTPTHSWMRGLYKYPQREFPYSRLSSENRRRGKDQAEFELVDTGVFEGNRYFDVFAEYAKGSEEDILIRIRVVNHGPEAAPLHLLPTLWFRNTWVWGCKHEGCSAKPRMLRDGSDAVRTWHESLGEHHFKASPASDGTVPTLVFTENETNFQRLFGSANPGPYVKDAFHRLLIESDQAAVNARGFGTKVAAWYWLTVPAGEEVTVELRLSAVATMNAGLPDFAATFAQRAREADEFYATLLGGVAPAEANVMRQAYAGLLWSKQFYHLIVANWLEGDPEMPPPPPGRKFGRNAEWTHLYSRDVLSMPDKWEYPWFAAWDLAFHAIPLADVDAGFAKKQLSLMLREWYMHPNGQIPAYEFAFGDVNPPVHAWAVWRVYKQTGPRGERDRLFLEQAFHKLLLNFTWWVNRKDPRGRNIFSGGFLGLDNVGVFDRSQQLPSGSSLEQADGTAWMAFFCSTMLAMALELAMENPAYEDIASKFFEHFVAIADAINNLGGRGLWDDEAGFYHDQLFTNGKIVPLKVRSIVGIIPLLTVEVLEDEVLARVPGFRKRMDWFVRNRPDLATTISWLQPCKTEETPHRWLLAIPSRERLTRVLKCLFDESEFLSDYGVRSLSRFHERYPFQFRDWRTGAINEVHYEPGESQSGAFGGNSNWRGPIWFPINYLIVEALERYHFFYGDDFKIEVPTGSGRMMNLREAAAELSRRLGALFLPSADGERPVHGGDPRYARDRAWKDLVLFYEHFHGDCGRGLGASHQTGWTALVARLMRPPKQ